MKRSKQEWIEVLQDVGAKHRSFDDPTDLYEIALAQMGKFDELGCLHDGDFVVDIGCGTGRLAIPLAERDVRYLGLDPIQDCIEQCKKAFAPWPKIQFVHFDVQNVIYNEQGTLAADRVRFPVDDGVADVVIFASVFTHLETIDICKHYLAETWRILKPGKACGCSWFRSPPGEPDSDPARTVLLESDIIEAIEPWTLLYEHGGATENYHDQWDMLLRKPHTSATEL